MYVYQKFERNYEGYITPISTYEVGFFKPSGDVRWVKESEYSDQADAVARVNLLNGGSTVPDLSSALFEIIIELRDINNNLRNLINHR